MARGRNQETERYKAILALAAVVPGLSLVRVQSGRIQTRRGGWVHLAPAGTADFLGQLDGRALAIEAKNADTGQDEDQRRWATAWMARGGLYLIARDVGELHARLLEMRARTEAA
jgi:hypothetical protein